MPLTKEVHLPDESEQPKVHMNTNLFKYMKKKKAEEENMQTDEI